MRMKEQGVRDDDPEYIKAHQLLAALSQHTQQMRKQQKWQQEQMTARQQQAQAQQQPVNGQANVNGVNGRFHDEVVVCMKIC